MSWHRWTLASLLLHGSLLGVAVRRARVSRTAPAAAATEVELLDVQDGAPRAPGAPSTQPSAAVSPRLGGRRAAQNIDDARPGEGGDGRSDSLGLNLAARAEGVDLDPRVMNSLRDRQEQRIRTASRRVSPQDDRRTPNPDDDPWVSTGGGILLFRLPAARALPARGALVPDGPARPEESQPSEADVAPRLARPEPAHVGAGVREGRGEQERVRGPMRTQRASLAQGHASTTSDLAGPRPDDDTDSALLAASLQRAFVSATTQSGPRRGEGAGGVGGGGAPGSGGGVGRGGRSAALGDGDGWISLSSDDERYMRYLLEVRRRLAPLWADAFPREAALRLEQGTVIVQFVIAADGAVRDVSLRRRSGIDAFDANVLAAVRRVSLPPIPSALGVTRLNVRAPFEFRNPVVR